MEDLSGLHLLQQMQSSIRYLPRTADAVYLNSEGERLLQRHIHPLGFGRFEVAQKMV
jgi:hypothetical protein